MIPVPPTAVALRKRADQLDAEAGAADSLAEGTPGAQPARPSSLLRVLAAEFRVVALLAEGGDFAEVLPGFRVVTHHHVPDGRPWRDCPPCRDRPDYPEEWRLSAPVSQRGRKGR